MMLPYLVNGLLDPETLGGLSPALTSVPNKIMHLDTLAGGSSQLATVAVIAFMSLSFLRRLPLFSFLGLLPTIAMVALMFHKDPAVRSMVGGSFPQVSGGASVAITSASTPFLGEHPWTVVLLILGALLLLNTFRIVSLGWGIVLVIAALLLSGHPVHLPSSLGNANVSSVVIWLAAIVVAFGFAGMVIPRRYYPYWVSWSYLTRLAAMRFIAWIGALLGLVIVGGLYFRPMMFEQHISGWNPQFGAACFVAGIACFALSLSQLSRYGRS